MCLNRKRPANTPEWGVDGVYFDGSGYVEVLFESLKGDRVFEQHVKLISQNGILLLFQREVGRGLQNLGFGIVWRMLSCVNVFLFPSQDKYVCIAVQGGLLKVLHNLDGRLSNLTDPQQESKIKISNAQAKFVSKTLYLFQNFPACLLISVRFFFFFSVFCLLFSVGRYLSTFKKWNASKARSSEGLHAF